MAITWSRFKFKKLTTEQRRAARDKARWSASRARRVIRKITRALDTYGAKQRAAREAAERAETRRLKLAREKCRAVVFTRAHGCCQHCGQPLKLRPSRVRHEFEIAHIHEEPPRSLGGDPTDPDSCVCLCYKCHDDITRHRLQIYWRDPVEKAKSGPVFRAA